MYLRTARTNLLACRQNFISYKQSYICPLHLFQCFTVSLYHCFTVSLVYCFTVSLFHCYTVMLFRCYTVSLFHCYTVTLFHCFTVSLFHCFTVSLFHCTRWWTPSFGVQLGTLQGSTESAEVVNVRSSWGLWTSKYLILARWSLSPVF